MLTHDHRSLAVRMLSHLAEPITLVVRIPQEGHEVGERLWRLAQELEGCSSRILVDREVCDGERPHMEVLSGNRRGVYYSALPLGTEWRSFLSTLQCASVGEPPSEAVLPLNRPMRLEVYTAPLCPHCARTVEMVHRVALAHTHVQGWTVDATLFPAEAEELGIRSTPTLVVDGVPRWVGRLSKGDLKEILGEAAAGEGWEATLRSLLAAGALHEALKVVERHPEALTALPSMLGAREFSLRLGALRLLEEVTHPPGSVLSEVIPSICALLKDPSPSIRGDVAYALGLLRDPAAREPLHQALRDPHPDVQEAVRDALEALGHPPDA